MKQSVVMFPGLGMGHINPIIELAKQFTARGLSVTVLILESPFDPSSTGPLVSRVSAANPSISFHLLPKVTPPPLPPGSMALFDIVKSLAVPNIIDFLKSLSETSAVRAFVVDYLCTETLSAASAELGVPAYYFCATSASNLIAMVLSPSAHHRYPASYKDLGETTIEFPGVPPIPASHMISPLMDRENPSYDSFLLHLKRLPTADGILVNTFERLEPRAATVLADGLVVPDAKMPPVYLIGPITGDTDKEEGQQQECLTWLDKQPRASVVYVSFGSMGAPPAQQLREIAVGLERSGHRFLWVVRSPPSDEPGKMFEPRPEPDLGALLPEGFLERTEGRGMVVKKWAPQVAVLNHEAVGAFVSHCGWNSTLEAVGAGVPVIAWPLFAEQRMNKVFLVEAARLAVALETEDWGLGSDGDEAAALKRMLMGPGLVRAEELEKKVRFVMEEGAEEMRERAKAMKEMAAAAREEGGSSHKAWTELMGVIKSDQN